MVTPEQREGLARNIDAWVLKTFSEGGGDEQLLATMYDHMALFKIMMDHSTPEEIDQLATKYMGFNRFAKLLESLATAIAEGRINPDELEPKSREQQSNKGFG